jgi:hypothetical protein
MLAPTNFCSTQKAKKKQKKTKKQKKEKKKVGLFVEKLRVWTTLQQAKITRTSD